MVNEIQLGFFQTLSSLFIDEKICQMKYNLNFPGVFELKNLVFVRLNFKLASFTL